jgi:molecular chaperone Hsp33
MAVDTLRRFLLEQAHVRGEWVHLDTTWQEMLQRADYPAFVRKVLGEALTAVALLSATIKHSGSLILQIRGDGPIHLLVVQATDQGTVRGLAQWNREAEGAALPDLFGAGHIAMTLEGQKSSERYQSLIPIEGESLAAALEAYFARSEQLPTRLWLIADDHTAAGMLLQRLPREHTSDEDWQRASLLLDTLTAQELVHLEPADVIYRLFHEEEPRLFDPKPIRFHCGCNRGRVESMLRSLGQAEAETILAEQGNIAITCEFCNATYTLDAVDVGQLFKPSMPGTDTLH